MKHVRVVVKFEANIPDDLNIREVDCVAYEICLVEKGQTGALPDVIWVKGETLSIEEVEPS